jgi:MATE family multidrug resistance protein
MFQIVSILFCGHIGPDELGAASLAFIMINVCGQTSVIGLLSACDTIFPQVFAGKNKKTTGIYLQKALLISMIWCMPVIGILTNSRLLISLVEKNSKIVK